MTTSASPFFYVCKYGHSHPSVEFKDECELATEHQNNLKETPDQLMSVMARTFRERNAVYGDNYKMVGPIMAILFPKGVTVEILQSPQFHLVELIVVKLSRFAVSLLKHRDSVHDIAVYGAMIESTIANLKEE